MTDTFYSSPQPVFTIDGDVKGELARDVVRIEVEESTGGLKRLRAHLAAFDPESTSQSEDLLYLDGSILDFGKSLRFAIGPAAEARTVFDGYISAIEASFKEAREPEVVVFAEDRLMDLRMTRRMKTWEQMSDAAIAEAIAAEHGMTPVVAADGPTYDSVQQWNMSDLAFLRERARRIQAEVWCDGETLGFQTRANRTGTDLTLVRGNQLMIAQIRADLAHQRTSVHISGYDSRERDVIDEQADNSAIQSEISGGKTGPDILKSAFGERVSHRVRDTPLTSTEASDWATAEMRRRARGFVQVTGMTDGTPDMIVGSQLTLERVGQPFEGGNYYVTKVRHTYDRTSAFRTHFEAERATVEGDAA